METNKLYSIADKSGITVDRFYLPENHSVSARLGSQMFVALDRGIRNSAEERVCLAHELGHCETCSFYNFYSPLDIREKHEMHANRWAIQKLIPKHRLHQAIKKGYTEIYQLAEYFDVTEDFMRKAAEYYKNKR